MSREEYRWSSHISDTDSFKVKHLPILEKNIPPNWDWRQIRGFDSDDLLLSFDFNYSCGACHVLASCRMLSYRIAVATFGRKRPNLSPFELIREGQDFVIDTKNNPQFNPTLRGLLKQSSIQDLKWYEMRGCEGGSILAALDYLSMKGVQEMYHTSSGIETKTRFFAKNVKLISGKNIQNEILFRGPVVAIYIGSNLEAQKNCVFSKPKHAVILLGWKKDNNGSFRWIAENTCRESIGKEKILSLKPEEVYYAGFSVEPNLNFLEVDFESIASSSFTENVVSSQTLSLLMLSVGLVVAFVSIIVLVISIMIKKSLK